MRHHWCHLVNHASPSVEVPRSLREAGRLLRLVGKRPPLTRHQQQQRRRQAAVQKATRLGMRFLSRPRVHPLRRVVMVGTRALWLGRQQYPLLRWSRPLSRHLLSPVFPLL